MEKSSGIWTQKMQMRLEKKWVVIIDNENGVSDLSIWIYFVLMFVLVTFQISFTFFSNSQQMLSTNYLQLSN